MLQRILTIIFLLVYVPVFSQKFLGLDKGGRIKRIRFYEGDQLTYKTIHTKHFITGTIENIGDSIRISGKNFGVDEITSIKVYPNSTLEILFLSGAINLPAAAALFVVSEAVSSQLHHDYPLVETKHLKLTAGLVLGGLLMYRLSYHNFKVGKKHPLRVYNLDN